MTGKVGFVGVGAMGGPMALNLAKAGFEVVVHDINLDRVAPLAAAGARVVDTPAAAAAECRRMICMVETADQAEAVIFGGNGFVQRAQPGDIVICSSTIDPLLARRFAEPFPTSLHAADKTSAASKTKRRSAKADTACRRFGTQAQGSCPAGSKNDHSRRRGAD